MPKMIGVALKIRNVEIQPAVVVVIAKGHAHCGHRFPTNRISHAGKGTDLAERAVVLVVKEISFYSVIRNEQIGPAIIVIIGCSYGEILSLRLKNVCGFGYVRERAVAIVVIENIRAAWVRRGRTTALHSSQHAIEWPVRFEGDITSHIQIEQPITIVVEEGCATMKFAGFEPCHPGF